MKKIKTHFSFLFAIIIFCCPPQLKASTNKEYCQNLAAFACHEGEYSEGIGFGSFPYPGTMKQTYIAKFILKSAKDFYTQNPNSLTHFYQYKNSKQPCDHSLNKCSDSQSLFIDNFAKLATMEIIPWKYYLKLFPEKSEQRITEEAQELREYYHATTNAYFLNDILKIKKKVIVDISGSNYLIKIQKYLEEVRPILIQVADSYLDRSPYKKMKNKIHKKINGIVFSGDCGISNYNINTDSLFENNLFYHPGTNTFKACMGMGVGNDSLFALIFDIAHEMGHSISPCGIDTEYNGQDFFNYTPNATTSERISQYPFNPIIAELDKNKITGLYENLDSGSSDNPMCSFDGNVLDESVADFLATKVLTIFMKKYQGHLSSENFANGFSNTFRFACGEEFSVVSEHPSAEERLNKIILSNKDVRLLMECPSNI